MKRQILIGEEGFCNGARLVWDGEKWVVISIEDDIYVDGAIVEGDSDPYIVENNLTRLQMKEAIEGIESTNTGYNKIGSIYVNEDEIMIDGDLIICDVTFFDGDVARTEHDNEYELSYIEKWLEERDKDVDDDCQNNQNNT